MGISSTKDRNLTTVGTLLLGGAFATVGTAGNLEGFGRIALEFTYTSDGAAANGQPEIQLFWRSGGNDFPVPRREGVSDLVSDIFTIPAASAGAVTRMIVPICNPGAEPLLVVQAQEIGDVGDPGTLAVNLRGSSL